MYKTIRQADPDFRFNDGLIIIPRAYMHITPDCPREYAQIINTCHEKGWLKLCATMRDSEFMWDKLSHE